MALVKHWIDGFLVRHRARFAPNDWPREEATDENREFLRGWITAFATREVTEAEADEASRLLVATPPSWRREHIPALLAKVEEIRKSRGGAPTSTREAARDASRDCPHCGGEGLATAWAEAQDPAKRIPATVASYCICAHGRWIRRSHAERDPAMLRRIPDFAAVQAGDVPGWLDWPPGVRRPEAIAAPQAVHRSAISEMFRVPEGAEKS
jgi:hypothetical protein